MFWQDKFYSPIFFRYSCLNCLFLNTVSLSSKFLFQPHSSNEDSPNISSLYMFIPVFLACNNYCRFSATSQFSIVTIYSDIAIFKWFIFWISCSSYNCFSYLPPFVIFADFQSHPYSLGFSFIQSPK